MKKLIVLLVLVMVFLPSFSNNGVLDKFFNVSIEKLQKNPEEYRNKEIKIKGTVINFDYDKCNKKLILDNTKPLFYQSDYINNYSNNLYICAPKQDFVKGLTQIGIEVYKGSFTKISLKTYLEPKQKDPIVLLPVHTKLDKQIGFIVISKWGLEADDADLMVGINN